MDYVLSIELDRQWRAQLSGGVPASMIPPGVHPVQAMVQAEKDARPRRRSVLEDALSNSGTTYDSFRPVPDDES